MLIAPALDMTERLMWHRMSAEVKAKLERDGVYYEPSLYGDPYPITKHLIEEGRNHLIGDAARCISTCRCASCKACAIPTCPGATRSTWSICSAASDVELTLIKDGDHRQSRPQDLRRLEATVAALVEKVQLRPAAKRGLRGRWDSAA